MHENGIYWFRKTSMLPTHTGCTWPHDMATFIIFVECSRFSIRFMKNYELDYWVDFNKNFHYKVEIK